MLKKLMTTAAVAALTAAVSVSGADAAEDFYKDKTITLIINLSAGGSTGRTATVFSRHWGKHIPGNPNFVVQPVTGGGLLKGIIAAKNARPDGLTIAWSAWGAPGRKLGPKSQQVDWNEFEHIAGAGALAMAYMRKDVGSGLEKPTDIANVDGVKIGGYRSGSYLDLQARMSLDLLGVDYGYTTGFRGGSKIVAALQRDEINFHAVPAPNYFAGINKNIVEEGIGLPLWYYPITGEDGELVDDPTFGDIKPFHEVYKDVKGEYPSGPVWEAMKWLNDGSAGVTWFIAAPEGTDPEKVEILRESFMATTKDPEYIKEIKKVSALEPPVVGPKGVQRTIDNLSNVDPKTVEILQGYIKSATK